MNSTGGLHDNSCAGCVQLASTLGINMSLLAQVYSDPRNVDDDLVTSIVQPAESSGNAPEVEPRSGDPSCSRSDPTLQKLELGWGKLLLPNTTHFANQGLSS